MRSPFNVLCSPFIITITIFQFLISPSLVNSFDFNENNNNDFFSNEVDNELINSKDIPISTSNNSYFNNLEPALGFVDPSQCTVNDGCDDTFSTIDDLNKKIRPHLQNLVHSDFFKFFKLQLYKSCPFWPENPMCFSPSCAVDLLDDSVDYELDVIKNSTCSSSSSSSSASFKKLMEYNCDYCNTSEESQDDAVFVDLTLNPERFSGYGGKEAGRIWTAIYQENCFNKPKLENSIDNHNNTSPAPRFNNKYFNLLASWSNRLQKNDNIDNYQHLVNLMNQEEDQCIEKRVFYRLVSGMHASIATHLSFEWLNSNKKNAQFEPNLKLWMERVGYFGDRLSNIYFNYSLVVKAILKLSEYLSQIQFSDINFEQKYINDIVETFKPFEDSIFKENLLFNYEDDLSNQLLKNEFKSNFKNVSTLMDCVGCERCRLWGKVQTLGYGTSLKILFELNDDKNENFDVKSLKRSEIVALLNTFDRLSKSISIINYFRNEYVNQNNSLIDENVNDDSINIDFLTKNEKKISYQQKIFKELNSLESESSSTKTSSKSAEIKKVPEVIKSKNVEESKNKLKKMFKQKRQDYESSSNPVLNSDIVRYEDEDDEDIELLTPEEIKHRQIFRNSLKLKLSKKAEDKEFNDHLLEVVEEFKDAFKFIIDSYLYFPHNITKIILSKLEIYWNWFIGNEEFFQQKQQTLHKLP